MVGIHYLVELVRSASHESVFQYNIDVGREPPIKVRRLANGIILQRLTSALYEIPRSNLRLETAMSTEITEDRWF